MTREARRRQADRLLASRTSPGEEILGCGLAWVARVRPGRSVWLAGRRRHLVVLTDRRLVTFRRTHGDAAPTLDLALDALRLSGEHPSKPFFQLLVAHGDEGDDHTSDPGLLVLELRHRDHAFARALAHALGAHTGAGVVPTAS